MVADANSEVKTTPIADASNYYNELREKLIKSLAYIEAKIDFAEDDLP